MGIRTYHFFRQMEKLFAAADLVVCMGGYNTLCEILSQGTMSLVIPRETPRKEQLIRARAFHRKGLVDYIPWNDFNARFLQEKLIGMLARPEPFHQAIAEFKMTGIDTMRQRLQHFRSNKS